MRKEWECSLSTVETEINSWGKYLKLHIDVIDFFVPFFKPHILNCWLVYENVFALNFAIEFVFHNSKFRGPVTLILSHSVIFTFLH